MDHGMNGKRIHMYSNKRDMKHDIHQETRSMDEEHICETMSIFIYFICVCCFFLKIIKPSVMGRGGRQTKKN